MQNEATTYSSVDVEGKQENGEIYSLNHYNKCN